jgi:hypothetical protein
MAQRYCTNCGAELREDDRFCPNCGRPVHETAAVSTPEADVPVPPPPQQEAGTQPLAQAEAQPRGPWTTGRLVLGCLGVFFVVFVVGASLAAIAGNGGNQGEKNNKSGGGKDELGTGNCRECLDDWWREAEKLSSVLLTSIRLGEAMREGSAAPIRKYFEGLGISFETDEAYLMAASTVAARLINWGLQDTKWGMVVGEPGELRLAHYPPNLVSAAYANLGALIATKAEFKECPGCSRAFLPSSGMQKYHDPQCATKARQRKWKREKAKDK